MNPLEIVLVGGLSLLVLLELRDVGFRRGLSAGGDRLRRNLAFLGATVVVMGCVRGVDALIREHAVPVVQWNGHLVLQLIVCFLLAELVGWLLHWVKHVNGYLWRFHFQHHREEQFDIWLTSHTHGLEVVISGALIAVLLGLAGFAPIVTETYLVVYSLVKTFQHSANLYSLGPLDWIVVGPAYHRIHHEVGSRWNYAVTITLYDVLFRTARWPARRGAEPLKPVGVAPGDPLPFGFWREMTFFLKRGGTHREP